MDETLAGFLVEITDAVKKLIQLGTILSTLQSKTETEETEDSVNVLGVRKPGKGN